MALETLSKITKIDGFKIFPDRTQETGRSWQEMKNEYFVVIDDIANSIAFKLQKGPIREVGVNGCQIDTMIHAAKKIIEGLNDNFPCRENSMAITKLDEAILWLGKRKADRVARDVEGTNQA